MSIPTKIELTESQLAWLLKHYKHTKNAEAARKLGIGESTLHRFARKYGLKKTPQFMRKTQRAAADAAERSHRENGNYPPKGYRVPRSEVGQFKPGVSSRQRLGDKKEDARLQKMAETRRETIRKEKARILFGLPQKTKLKLTSGGAVRRDYRYLLRKAGYIVGRGENVAYYDEETERRPRLEASARRHHIRIEEY